MVLVLVATLFMWPDQTQPVLSLFLLPPSPGLRPAQCPAQTDHHPGMPDAASITRSFPGKSLHRRTGHRTLGGSGEPAGW